MMTEGTADDPRHDGRPGTPGADPHSDEVPDALWQLLARAPAPRPVSPYFARRVLREVALLEESNVPRQAPAAGPFGWLANLRQTWRRQPLAASACAVVAVALLLAGGVGLTSPRWHAPPVLPPSFVSTDAATDSISAPDAADNTTDPSPAVALASAPESITAQDVEVIADLDNLISREESRLWTEDTARY